MSSEADEGDGTSVSIVMTYFERPDQLRVTLESFRYHGYGSDVEVVIVDDGSIDKPAQEVVGKYPFRVTVVNMDPAKKQYVNPCVPFNEGFRAAKGTIVVIQNAECFHYDDILSYVRWNLDNRSYLSFACFSLDKVHTEAAFVADGFSTLRESVRFVDRACGSDGEEGWYNHSLHRPCAYHFCSAIFARTLAEIGGFDERYAMGVGFDDDSLVRAAHDAKLKIRIVDEAVVVHQWHYSDRAPNARRDRLIFRNKQLYTLVTRAKWPYPLFEVLYALSSSMGIERNVFSFVAASRRIVKGLRKRVFLPSYRFFVDWILEILRRIMPLPDWRDVPVIINNRNRFSTTRGMIEWLLPVGCRRVVVLDNDSTYPPLLEYYRSLAGEPRVEVKFLGKNQGAYALWECGSLRQLIRGYYVYTDSDLLPAVGCPDDFMQRFLETLRQHPEVQKVGFGLLIDDIPDDFEKKRTVVITESAYWKRPLPEGGFFEAPIDTTFALYAPFQKGGPGLRALRSDYPYLLRHLPWYVERGREDDEERYYREHANSFSSSNVNFALKD